MNARDLANEIIHRLRAEGHTALLAGGCVRDRLLGREPSDYDVATDAPPDRISRLFTRTAEVGACFGVVLVRAAGHTVEVATFRADGAYSDARRPDSVTFSNPHDDAMRRDYTVNALFWSPDHPRGPLFHAAAITPSHGGGFIVDFVAGLADLDAKVLRAVGVPDQRLAEDHLRALRAVRLAAKLDFSVHPDTRAAITRHASDLRGVSRERIGDELRMMLEHPRRFEAVQLLHELGLLSYVLSTSSLAIAWNAQRAATVLRALPDHAGFPLALSACLTVIERTTPADLASARAALLLSNDERERAHAILTTLPQLREQWGTWPVALRKREASRAHFPDTLALLRALDPTLANQIGAQVRALEATPSGLSPAPLITGDTLTAMGYKPGPGFKKVLDAVYDLQLEERVTTEAQGRAAATQAAASAGLQQSIS